MDSIRAAGDRYVWPPVDEQARSGMGLAQNGHHGASKIHLLARGHIFFTQLDEVHAVGRPDRGLSQKRGAAFGFAVSKQPPVCDGVEHLP